MGWSMLEWAIMVLSIPISEQTCERLRSRASAAGQDVESYVARLVSHFADSPTPLEELSGPIQDAFAESGMTDDELGDLLDQAKHDMRAERRARQGK